MRPSHKNGSGGTLSGSPFVFSDLDLSYILYSQRDTQDRAHSLHQTHFIRSGGNCDNYFRGVSDISDAVTWGRKIKH